MIRHALAVATVAALFATTACNKTAGGNDGKNAQTPAAAKIAGDKTISAGLPAGSKFMAAAKAAGLDQTLAGPGPYTVLVPDDSAITGDAFAPDPANRAQLTGAITNLILPGTVLVADIDRAIDKGKGKDVLATMGGGTLTATKDGDKTVLTDSAGHKATITKGDDIFSNGVVHHIDAVLMPSKQAAASAPAVGQPAGK